MAGLVDRAVRVRERRTRVGPVVMVTWVLLPAKGGRTQIGPAHLNRAQALLWAKQNGYIALGGQ